MKKFLRKTLLIVMLMLCTSSIVFADTEGENGGLFSHINKLENNKYTVKYGTIVPIPENTTVTISDPSKVTIKDNHMFITGTGNFTISYQGSSDSGTLNVFSWNAYIDDGRYWVYTDQNLNNKESILKANVYLDLQKAVDGKSFKVNSYLFDKGSYSKDLSGKYLEDASEKFSYYDFSFTRSFNDSFEEVTLPEELAATYKVTGNEFSNITRFYNNTFIVKHGTLIRLTVENATITSKDTSKAQLQESDLIYINGTGSFKINLVKNNKSVDLNFFSWNAYMNKGSHPVFLDVRLKEEENKLYSKVYLALSETTNSEAFKIDDFCFIDGSYEKTVLKGKYLKDYSDSANSYYTYALEKQPIADLTVPPKPVTIPEIIPSTVTVVQSPTTIPTSPSASAGNPNNYFYDPSTIIANMPSNKYNYSTTSSSSLPSAVNNTFLGTARECITWLSQNGYKYSQGNRIPLYKSGGIEASSWIPKSSREVDCSAYVSWVLYEYGRRTGIKELEKEFDGYQWSSSTFHGLAKDLSKGKTNGYRKYFQLVWLRGKFSSDPSYIKSVCKPGDILIFREGTGHVELFISGWDGNTCRIYSCGSTPSGKYNSGNPRTRNMGSKSGHGFWDLSSIVRVR